MLHAGVIADDLTGAADTAVQFARTGSRAAVVFRGAPVPPARDLDVLALDTDSRALPAGAAAERAAEAAGAVRSARLVYKKLDSTLRGPIAAELAAALSATGRVRVIVAPAFPAAGRTTVRGVQLVRGVPVHASEAAGDPRTPVTGSRLPELLAGAFPSVVSLGIGDLADPATVRRALDSASCIVADAKQDADLAALVRAVPTPREVLWAGSAGLALALGDAYPGPRAADTSAPSARPPRAVLVVVGSLSGVAREQLRSLQRRGCAAIPVTAAGRSASDAAELEGAAELARAALAERSCAALHSADRRVAQGGTQGSGSPVAALAVVAAQLARDFDALVLTGGETAVGVARSLGAGGILLEGELEPGIPVGTLLGPSPFRVVTKAGAFGGPDTLRRVVEQLLESGEGR